MKMQNCSCWEITKCKHGDNCPTRCNPDIPCWENCYIQKDLQKVFDVCRNCAVFMKNRRNGVN